MGFFWKEKAAPLPNISVYSSPPKAPVDYTGKDNPAEKITYSGIGQTKYAAGFPPSLYDTPINAIRSYPIVYAAITAISEAISGLGIKIFQLQGGQRVEVTDHAFYTVFANPNPYQGSFEFMEQLQQSLDVCGNVFILKEPGPTGVELYILNPKYVAIIPDPTIKVKMYRYYINGQSIDFPPEDVIHIKYNDVDDPYYGMPPLATATDIITFEKNRIQFANQYFVNGAIPAGVLETEQVLGETLLKKLRKEWSGIHQGVGNSHKVGILQGGLKYRGISSPIKDLDFPGLKRMSKEDILSIYKIPESILGSQDGTGSKEGRDAVVAFWRQCIVPRLKRIESGLNRGLKVEMFSGAGTTGAAGKAAAGASAGPATFVFEFNLKDVAALQDDKTELSDYLQKMVASSIMTSNEARAVIGLPKSTEPNADLLLVSNSFFGNQLMPVAAAQAQGAGSNAPKPAAAPGAKPPATPPAAKPKPPVGAKPGK